MPPSYPFPTPLPVVPGGYLVRAIGSNTASGTPVTLQFAFTISGAAPLPGPLTVGAAFASSWLLRALQLFHPTYESSSIGVTDLSTATSVEQFQPAIGPGTSSGVAAPPNITALARFNTNVRRKRGHVHISPISDFSIAPDGNHVSDSYRLLMETQLSLLLSDFVTNPAFAGYIVTHCVMSKITNKVYDGRLIPVTTVEPEQHLGSQRRRRGY